jgi:putative membrane protein
VSTAGTTTDATVDTRPWLRLDPRMLLVHPIKELVKFLPVLIGIMVAGSASGGGLWGLLGVAVPVGLGVVRYLTTSYRISDTRVELKRGLLQRHTLSTATDRVRTVDLTATLAHRALGLETVVIGTGSTATDADDRLELDALPKAEAAALRVRLLQAVSAGTPADPDADPDADSAAVGGLAAAPLARFEPRWLWYAPFTSAGLVALGAFVGVLVQASESLDIRVNLNRGDLPAATGVLVASGLVTAILLTAVLTVGGYLVVNGGFTLTRHQGAWHIRRGLLTTRDTSIDETRVAGVSRGEPAGLRLARGARLSAIATGLAGTGQSSTNLVPPAPRETVATAAAAVLGSSAPMDAPLRPHGPAAVRRRYSRALLGCLPLVVLLALPIGFGAPAWLLLVAAVPILVALLLARDRARSLGHALVDDYVVMRSGSLLRQRDVLGTSHIIGWTFRDTWFQRRLGLATIEATTAGGGGRIGVADIPFPAAVTLADAASPGLIAQFLAGEAAPATGRQT